MTILEATVEITKASFSQGAASTFSGSQVLIHDKTREAFLKGIEELYSKLKEMEGIKD
jgi:hypothetical protein